MKTHIKVDTEEVKKFLDEAKDWYVRCRHCGVDLIGTKAELQAHKCEIPDGK